MTQVKICGITNEKDVEYINAFLPDYAGFVMFYPKSKRNLSVQRVEKLLSLTDKRIKKVAVTVSPNEEQLKKLESMDFDCVQIHGEIADSLIDSLKLPVFKAFNVSDFKDFGRFEKLKNVKALVFDAAKPGSGKTFDWETLNEIHRGEKLLALAGGLNCDNVRAAMECVNPDIADVSSGVENENGDGKDREKIKRFINSVRYKE